VAHRQSYPHARRLAAPVRQRAASSSSDGYGQTTEGIDFRPWHNYQRWLAAGDGNVIIAFARTLARLIPAKSLRLRRDVGQLMRAIKAHALGRAFRAQGHTIGKLNAAAVEALADPAVRSRLAGLGLEVFPREQQTPEALGKLQRADAEKWWPIIKEYESKHAKPR
jgi:hypothetical protein